jgi:hypothetical protein
MRIKQSFMLLLLVFAYAGLQTRASAQCAVCSIPEFCFECTQGPEGGTSCFTNGCFRCRTTGTCPVPGATSISPKASLTVDPGTVSEIATRSPQLAAILSDLGKEETIRETYTFYLAGIQVNPEDMEWWLNPGNQSTASFARARKELKRLRGKPALLYDVSLEANSDSPLGTLIVQRRNTYESDSSASLLQVTLVEDSSKGSLGKRKWTVLSWQIK